MKQNARKLAHAAIIAALYAVLTHLQNLILPGSASWAIQCRMSEVLCVLALLTPAAIPGLTAGCLLFNITSAAVLPLDFFIGSIATFWAATGIWRFRNIRFRGYPLLSMIMPALTNAVLVGWELTAYIGGGFPINAAYVALGELIVLLIPGSILFYTIKKRRLDQRIFH